MKEKNVTKIVTLVIPRTANVGFTNRQFFLAPEGDMMFF